MMTFSTQNELARRRSRPARRAGMLIALVAGAVTGPAVLGDVGPPVEIKLQRNGVQAVAGQEYAGTFLVYVYRAATLTNFEIEGQGWNVLEILSPGASVNADAGVFEVKFRAIPSDANQPIALSFSFNGRRVRQQYEAGPDYFDRASQPRVLSTIPGSEALARKAPLAAIKGGEVTTSSQGGTVQVYGRIIYNRPGIDGNGDGDFLDPGDIPPEQVGADEIDVRLWDSDPVGHETMWEGITDEEGYFDTGPVSADVDGDGSGPDLVIYVEAERGGWVDVTNTDEETYYWQSPEVTNFEESVYNFGWLTPLDTNQQPALHIYNSITRARRFIIEKPGVVTPEVAVRWPDDSMGNKAWYESGAQAIHVSTFHTWRESTHTHEYGHHFMYTQYFNDPPDPEYCNAGHGETPYCDDASGVPSCYATPPSSCTHCVWCPETDHDAFNEGWPNWLADVVTRDYLLRYQHDDGSPFTPLYPRSQENLGTCCQDGMPQDPLRTEGFVGALLRDIEDASQDDHDGDGILDRLCLGPNPIFGVLYNWEPTTVNGFIAGFLAEYPEYYNALWSTAYNVGGSAYVSSYPTDVQPPGTVPWVDSPTHPIGTGGNQACITVELGPPDDDATGDCAYSYVWSSTPGMAPGMTAEPVDFSGCLPSVTGGLFDLGDWYLSVRAQDCAGHWSPDWNWFGPFTVGDCNNNGILDVCEVSCDTSTLGLACTGGDTLCLEHYPDVCGFASDCNHNAVPDECDLAGGTSDDCNTDGIPDECQPMRNYTGTTPSEFEPPSAWACPGNWRDYEKPTTGDHACIRANVPTPLVSFTDDLLVLSSLSCEISLLLNGEEPPAPDLALSGPSFISGNLTIFPNATLINNDNLYIGGALNWDGGIIRGTGDTNVAGGMALAPPTNFTTLTNGHHLSLIGGGGTAVGKYIRFEQSSLFTIGEAAQYTFTGDGQMFLGGSTTLVDLQGALNRVGGGGYALVNAPVNVSGLFHNLQGLLKVTSGGTHTGIVVSDPGTILALSGPHDFLPSSTLVAHDLVLDDASANGYIRGTLDIGNAFWCTGHTWVVTDEANIVDYSPELVVMAGGLTLNAPTDRPVDFQEVQIGSPPGEPASRVYFDTGQPFNVSSLEFNNGDIYGNSPINVTGQFTWNDGGFHPGGDVTVTGSTEIPYTNHSRTLQRSLVIDGHATQLAGITLNTGTRLDILPNAIYELIGASTISGGGVINNSGLLLKSTANALTTLFYTDINNTGFVEFSTGTVHLQQMDYVQTAGGTVLNGATITSSIFGPMRIEGGLLLGYGPADCDVLIDGGTAAPGLSVGELIIGGDYAQTSNGALEIEITSNGAGGFDVLTVGGNASLAGAIEVQFLDGFVPNVGDTFEILTATSVTGEFDQVIRTGFPAGLSVQVIYAPDSVTLEIVAVAPGDCDEDGDIDLFDYECFHDCVTGPGGGLLENCNPFDFDTDLDVDLDDVAAFQEAFEG